MLENEIIVNLTYIEGRFRRKDSEKMNEEERRDILKMLQEADEKYFLLRREKGQTYRQDLGTKIETFKDKLTEYES